MQGTPTWAPTLFMYVAFAAIFYFILWRPQAQQRKRHEQLIQQLKRGDEVVTAGGVIGRVEHIQELTTGKPGPADRITIRSGDSRLIVERGRIASVASSSASSASTAANG
jgi:preprotein translocase subunit YajC